MMYATPGGTILIGGDPKMNHSDWRDKQFILFFLAPLLSIRVNTQASTTQVGNRVTVCSTSNYIIILYMLNSIVLLDCLQHSAFFSILNPISTPAGIFFFNYFSIISLSAISNSIRT